MPPSKDSQPKMASNREFPQTEFWRPSVLHNVVPEDTPFSDITAYHLNFPHNILLPETQSRTSTPAINHPDNQLQPYMWPDGTPYAYAILERILRQNFDEEVQWAGGCEDTSKEWSEEQCDKVRKVLVSEDAKLPREVLTILIEKATAVLKDEPNLIEIDLRPSIITAAETGDTPPDHHPHDEHQDTTLAVLGDFHGQFVDLLQAIYVRSTHSITESKRYRWLFLGDYVDRGAHGVEIMIYLCLLKLLYPGNFFLLRGNHESRSMTSKNYKEGIGFKKECELKYGLWLWDLMMNLFDTLPIAATISSVYEGKEYKLFAAHGGISSKIKTLDDINKVHRFEEPPKKGPLCDLLWSDPFDMDSGDFNDETYKEFFEVDFIPNVLRGCSITYCYDLMHTFLAQNGLSGIIRGHEVARNGVQHNYHRFRVGMDEKEFPMVTTIFSAPNYCGTYGNLAALLEIIPYKKLNAVVYGRPQNHGGRVASVDEFANARISDQKSEKHPGWQAIKSAIKFLQTKKHGLQHMSSLQALQTAFATAKSNQEEVGTAQDDHGDNQDGEGGIALGSILLKALSARKVAQTEAPGASPRPEEEPEPASPVEEGSTSISKLGSLKKITTMTKHSVEDIIKNKVTCPEDIPKLFHELDVNGDKTVQLDEMLRLFERDDKPNNANIMAVKSVFHQLGYADTSGLTYEEFEEWLLQFLDFEHP